MILVTIIFAALTVFVCLQIIYSTYIVQLVLDAMSIVANAKAVFESHPDKKQELFYATNDLNILFRYGSNVSSYINIVIFIFVMNLIGFAAIVSITLGSTYDTFWLYAIIAACDSLIIMNAYNMQKWKSRIHAVCTAYTYVLQTMQYIEAEPDKNQKDG